MSKKALVSAGKKISEEQSKQRNVYSKQAAAIEQILSLGKKVNKGQEGIVAAKKREEKILKNYVEQVKNVFSQLNALVALIENDPTVKRAEIQLSRAEAEFELATALGRQEDNIGNVLEARLY